MVPDENDVSVTTTYGDEAFEEDSSAQRPGRKKPGPTAIERAIGEELARRQRSFQPVNPGAGDPVTMPCLTQEQKRYLADIQHSSFDPKAVIGRHKSKGEPVNPHDRRPQGLL